MAKNRITVIKAQRPGDTRSVLPGAGGPRTTAAPDPCGNRAQRRAAARLHLPHPPDCPCPTPPAEEHNP